MRRVIFMIGIFFLSLGLYAQEIKHESLVVNIEVPVRVFKGSRFIDNMTMNDFEVYEDGKLQKIEAVYLIKKKSLERKEENIKFSPDTSRTFYLFFQITEFNPRIKDALHYFVQNVLAPDDTLFIVSPLKSYEMHPEALELKSNDEIVNELNEILRRDAMIGSSEYRSSIAELTKLARTFSAAFRSTAEADRKLDQEIAAEYAGIAKNDPTLLLEMLTATYTSVLERLEEVRSIDQAKLLDFAEFLKNKKGQKYVFLFYQREFIPQIDPSLLNRIVSLFQEQHIIQNLSDVFQSFKRKISFDIDRVKQAYADSSTSIHFMFFTMPAEHIPGVRFEEHSEDIYAAFREMASGTGGITESSANPFYLFRSAVESSENYYLLYYAPLSYKKDGKFRNISVKVKDKDCRVIHRAGYFAN